VSHQPTLQPTLQPAPAPAGPPSGEITVLLHRAHAGDAAALERLFPLVYDELRATAGRALAREQAGHTLHATDLVHEAYFKLAGGALSVQDRAHFYGVAARAMRQVLVEHARRRLADKRGGGVVHVTLGDRDAPAFGGRDEELLALDEALERLGAERPRLRALVEHRFFGGLSEKEIAALLGVSERTVQRDWAHARAWLYKELYPARDAP
jgi:RNA polymerase sigma factor (TIGR02999 family)